MKMFERNKSWVFGKFVMIICFYISNSGVARGEKQCCPQNTYLVENSLVCSDNKTNYNLNCPYGALLLDPASNENDKFTLEFDGKLIVFDGEKRTENEFCLGRIESSDLAAPRNVVALVCFGDDDAVKSETTFVSIVLRLLMLISTLFLLLTLYIYVALPSLRDIQGKCVVAFICSLLSSYTTLLVIQTFPNSSQAMCVVQAKENHCLPSYYSIICLIPCEEINIKNNDLTFQITVVFLAGVMYFFMSSCFFWNNVITFNIWKAIRRIPFKIKERSWMILYLLWGFGIPFVMVSVSFILENLPGGNHVRPHFAETKCWFKGKVESWSYFHGPISLLILLNTFMFVHSSCMLWKSYRGSTISTIRSLRFKFLMYLKLFLLMGISWIFEMISYATNDYTKYAEYLWFLTDCLNSAQGIIIFLILVVFRQKVKYGLLSKRIFGIKWPESWANEKVQESSTTFFEDDFELEKQKIRPGESQGAE